MSHPNNKNSYILFDLLWDLWCLISIVGIWPRWIEPNLVVSTQKKLPIKQLPLQLEHLRILQISDLHLSHRLSDTFIKKILRKVKKLKPDLILFTGDFLCYSQLNDKQRLKELLCSMEAPHGCYAIFGNHDYQEFVSVNSKGDYDLIEKSGSTITRGFRRLFQKITLTKKITERAQHIGLHEELVQLLRETPFKLLHNTNELLPIKGSYINLCGLGEYMLGNCLPQEAFKNYDPRYPGIVLAHNPDAIPHLKEYPGNIILCGHTHGYQINLPWLRDRFALIENRQYARGLNKEEDKWIYTNRGLAGVLQFRWFAIPEILLITLQRDQNGR